MGDLDLSLNTQGSVTPQETPIAPPAPTAPRPDVHATDSIKGAEHTQSNVLLSTESILQTPVLPDPSEVPLGSTNPNANQQNVNELLDEVGQLAQSFSAIEALPNRVQQLTLYGFLQALSTAINELEEQIAEAKKQGNVNEKLIRLTALQKSLDIQKQVSALFYLRAVMNDLSDQSFFGQVDLGSRPDVMAKLLEAGILPPMDGGGWGGWYSPAKTMARYGQAPYDNPAYAEMAKNLPSGWESLSPEGVKQILAQIEVKLAQLLGTSLSSSVIQTAIEGVMLAQKNIVRYVGSNQQAMENFVNLLSPSTQAIFRSVNGQINNLESQGKLYLWDRQQLSAALTVALMSQLFGSALVGGANPDKLTSRQVWQIVDIVRRMDNLISNNFRSHFFDWGFGNRGNSYNRQAIANLMLGFILGFNVSMSMNFRGSPAQMQENLKKIGEQAPHLGSNVAMALLLMSSTPSWQDVVTISTPVNEDQAMALLEAMKDPEEVIAELEALLQLLKKLLADMMSGGGSTTELANALSQLASIIGPPEATQGQQITPYVAA